MILYLIDKLWFFLFVALVIGVIVGWLVPGQIVGKFGEWWGRRP